MNAFWTLLTILDPLVALLLAFRRRAGAMLGMAVMIADVAVNTHALFGLGWQMFQFALVLQALFAGSCWAPRRPCGL